MMKKLLLLFLISFILSPGSHAQVMAPYTETFSNAQAGYAIPSGWINTSTTGFPTSLWRSSNGRFPTSMAYDASVVDDHTGDNGYFLWVSAGYLFQAGNSATLETDYINMDSLSNPEMSLAIFSFDTSNVQLAPDANKLKIDFFDGVIWHDSIFIYQDQNSPHWQTEIIDLTPFTSASTDLDSCKFRFRVEAVPAPLVSAGYNMFNSIAIDDISVRDPGTCSQIDSLAISNITANMADLDWDAVTAAASYEVEYWVRWNRFQQGSSTLGGDTISVSGNSAQISGLKSNTPYAARVRTVCQGGGFSHWSPAVQFETSCGPITAPYTNDFETYDWNRVGLMPSCWDFYMTTPNGTPRIINTPFLNYSPPLSLEFNAYLHVNDSDFFRTDTAMVILPEVSDLPAGDKQLTFQLTVLSSQPILVGTMASASPSSQFNLVKTIIGDSSLSVPAFQKVVIPFTSAQGYNGTDTHIAIRVEGQALNLFSKMDNFEYDFIPSCPEINKVVFTTRTDSSASFNIDVGSHGASFNAVWGVPGFDPVIGGIGAGVVQGNTFTISDTVDNTANPTGLQPGTRYQLYLKNVCDNNYYGPVEFTTACSPFTAPYYTGFESTNFLIEDCWRSYTTSNTTLGVVNDIDNVNPFQGSQHLNMDNGASRILGDTLLVISPFFSDMTDGNKRIRFQLRSDEHTLQKMFAAQSGIVVGTMGSDKPSDFHPMDTIYPSANATYEEVTVQLDSLHGYNGIDTLIGFVHGFQATYENFYIDEFHYEDNPCGDPTDLTALNVVDSGATLEWKESLFSNAYEVWVGPAGFYQGTYTTAGLKTTVTSPSLVLDTLSDFTCYDYLVRTLCSSDSSQWVGPYQFCTPCKGPLAGSYTIGSSASVDFDSFSKAAQRLETCGMSGAVVISVEPGTYTDTLHLRSIAGLSKVNTLTFNGNAAVLAHPLFANTQTTILIDSNANVILRNLHVNRNSYPTSITPVSIQNSDNITLDSCIISLDTTATYYDNGVSVTNSDTVTISNTTTYGGIDAISIRGKSAVDFVNSLYIINNHLNNFEFTGLYLQDVNSAQIRGNNIHSMNMSWLGAWGVMAVGYRSLNIEQNRVHTFQAGVALQDGNLNNQSSTRSALGNNMILSEGFEGIYITNTRKMGVYHNSVSGKPALFIEQQDSIDVRNNIFTSPSGVAVNFADGISSGDSLNYNIYYRDDMGTPLVEENAVSYNTLSAWKIASTAYNVHSLEGDPGFVSYTDMHLSGILANDAGDTTLNITTDIDGDARLTSSPLAVDIGADEYTPLQDDLSATAIIGLTDGACGDTAQAVSVIVTNHGLQTQSNFDVTLNLSGASSLSHTVTYSSTLPASDADTLFIANLDLSEGGTYHVKAFTQLGSDQSTANDTVRLKLTQFSSLPPVPLVNSDTICLGKTATLYTPWDGGLYKWETVNGDSLSISDSLVVGPLSGTDTTIVLRPLSLSVPDTIGEKSVATASSTSSIGGGLRFKVKRSLSLDSVKVYSATSGGYVLSLVDNQNSQVIYEDTVYIAGSSNAIWLSLNHSLSPGDYTLHGAMESLAAIPMLSYNNGPSSFPYIVNGALEIYESFTKSTWGPAITSTQEYRYFYDWQISLPEICRTPGQITLYSDSSGAVNAVFSSNPGAPGPTTLTVAFDANSSSGGSTYSWDFGDGNTGTGVMPNHTYTANGTYNVHLVVVGNCGSDTLTQQVVIKGISVVENELDRSLSLYPNPAKTELTIAFSAQGSSKATILVRDVSGRLIYRNEMNDVNGEHTLHIDVRSWAKGVYMVEVTTGNRKTHRRITRQ